MVNYQSIAALVNQISVDTWDVLRQIKERRNDRNARKYDRQHMSLLRGRRTFGSNHSSYPSTFPKNRLVSIHPIRSDFSRNAPSEARQRAMNGRVFLCGLGSGLGLLLI